MNRARPMAARLKNNKPRVNHEPRLAHGRAVNKKIFVSLTSMSTLHNYLGVSQQTQTKSPKSFIQVAQSPRYKGKALEVPF